MLQSEFEERTGLKVTADEYNEIDIAYMASSLEKDDFCKMWKTMDYVARQQMIYMAKELQIIAKKNSSELKCWKEERIKIGEFLADEAQKYSSEDARAMAIKELGFKEYIAYKVRKGYPMWDIDLKDIVEHL